MTIEWITSWWNLIFIVPFGLGLMYLGLYTVSGWTFGDADGGSGLEHDVDAHVDVDHDLSADADTDADTDTDSDSDTNDAPHASAFLSILNWIGVGRVPVSLVLMILMLSWGAIGFGAIQIGRGWPVFQAVAVAVAAAGVGSSCITHVVSSILGPMLFSNKNAPLRRNQLLGSTGETMYPVDTKFGMVCGRDSRGELFQVACRVGEDQESLEKGVQVRLAAYSAEDRMFYVVPVQVQESAARVVART